MSEIRVTGETSAGESFDLLLHLNDDGRAMQLADDVVYKRQREWAGLIMRDNLKLRRIIADAILTGIAYARAAAFEEAAKVADDQANAYPADVWPDDSTHPDAIAARTMRVMLPKLAAAIRRLGGEGDDN